MRRTFLLIGAALGLLAPPGLAAAAEVETAFAAMDANGDGMLDVDEYVAAVVHRFGELDADDDRMLTATEIGEVDRDAFVAADRDGDGELSLGEAVGDRMIRFFDADSSRDGTVTLVEINAYLEGLE
ncbi:EF-hand domain-containing protein [Albimonas pacifica]|uniref:EF hand n=1 Tax=Albimonas pacifica TaxID=1114924 RepID=A0A1I3ITZ7_9RHOB|nr:EF-hand domain-containing protein [Albimonas pacifica]SFI51357.1 EF hand [Albimonas pacifica]